MLQVLWNHNNVEIFKNKMALFDMALFTLVSIIYFMALFYMALFTLVKIIYFVDFNLI